MSYTIYSIANSNSIVLRDPDLGDKDTVNLNKINNVLENGRSNIFKDAAWFAEESKIFNFSALTQTERDNFIVFLKANNGLKVRVTDHNAELFYGYLIPASFETTTIRDICSYTINLVFLQTDIIYQILGVTSEIYLIDHSGNKILVRVSS